MGKNKVSFLVMLSVLLICMAGFFGCKNDDDDDGIPGDLVAKWYSSQEEANTQPDDQKMKNYEFRSDGKFLVNNGSVFGSISVSGDTITAVTSWGTSGGTAKYAIDETKLTISEAESGSGLQNGSYYKKE
ncbi:MAG: hypothetical protein LBD29_06280 [Treponema sp.]|jgi:hypothetical protein|nr:hypothetical protein [Treponema sp.]